MAIETIRRCDIYGTRRDVKRYRVEVFEVDAGADTVPVYMEEADLGQRGLDRLRQRIADGLSKPNRRGRKPKENGDTAAMFADT